MRHFINIVEAATRQVAFADLPDDMQTLLTDFVLGYDWTPEQMTELEASSFPLRTIPLSSIPNVPLDPYDRGEDHARAMMPGETPPIIIADGHFLDGRHRVFAARERGDASIEAMDLTGMMAPATHRHGMGPLTEAVAIDNVNGLGNVPDNDNIDYLGFRVLMRPSTFLALAPPIEEERQTVPHVVQHLQNGGAVASPFLDLVIPGEWEDGDLAQPARVRGHEGRHRMVAIKQLYGDAPVEVHLLFSGGYRARHIQPEWLARINAGMIREKSKQVVRGPLFDLS